MIKCIKSMHLFKQHISYLRKALGSRALQRCNNQPLIGLTLVGRVGAYINLRDEKLLSRMWDAI